MKLIIDIPWQIKECLNNENEWTALLLAELKDIVNNGTPLEQEPKTDVLDKIQEEIRHFMYDINSSSSHKNSVCTYVLQIIDKYRKESEET